MTNPTGDPSGNRLKICCFPQKQANAWRCKTATRKKIAEGAKNENFRAFCYFSWLNPAIPPLASQASPGRTRKGSRYFLFFQPDLISRWTGVERTSND